MLKRIISVIIVLLVTISCFSSPLTQLLEAIDNDDLPAVLKALERKPNLEAQCPPYEICKPLARAASRGDLSIVKALIAAGADPNGKNAYGDTAFILADHAIKLNGKTESDVRAIRIFLVENGLDVNQPNAFAISPFIGICASGDIEMAKLALKYGAKINATYLRDVQSEVPDRNSALMWAATEGHREMVDFLIENGADIHYRNEGGQSAADWALSGGHEELSLYLLSISRND
jgi:ankyrin repeat protein